MSTVVIRAENLGKKYVIGHQAEDGRYVALRDVLMHNVRSMWQKTKDLVHGEAIVQGDSVEEIWALRDINFEMRQGEVVGIIGRNGSGKSTLLKVLSRITEPTEGRVSIRGRVSSLLEVGTGFHPELTGRENIFLNGAILGMTRAEIRRKFDEIVAFAEIEKFLDTPVKRYSSGMYVRLAFAVAAHLEPEILLVDEVLAVGDAEFQKKCLGKMSIVASEGRTVLLVSHNLEAVRRICIRGVFLSSGRIQSSDRIDQCIESYIARSIGPQAGNVIEFPPTGLNRPHIRRIEILDQDGRPFARPRTWDFVKFRIFFCSPVEIKNGSVVLYVSTTSGSPLTLCSTQPDSAFPMIIGKGEGAIDCDFPRLPLSGGTFIIGAGLAIPNVEWLDHQQHVATFEVVGRDIFHSGLSPSTARYPVPIEHYWSMPQSNSTLNPELVSSGPVRPIFEMK